MEISWTTRAVKLKEMKPFDENPRAATEKEYNDVKESIEKFNLVELPVVNMDGTIIAGHLRARVLIELYGPEHEIQVRVPNRHLTQDEFREYLIRSNKNTGHWSMETLAEFFSEDELISWGWEDWELGAKEEDFDEGFSLNSGEKAPFQQMTFTLADEQADEIRAAIKKAKEEITPEILETFGNENANGNHLYMIIKQWAELSR